MNKERFNEENIDDAATLFIGGRSWISFDILRESVIPALREVAKETGSAGMVISTLDYILSDLDAGTKGEHEDGED